MVYPYQNNTFFQTARYPRLPVTPFPKNQSCPIDLFNSTEPDYSKMTLREELEYRLNDMKRQQQEKRRNLFSQNLLLILMINLLPLKIIRLKFMRITSAREMRSIDTNILVLCQMSFITLFHLNVRLRLIK